MKTFIKVVALLLTLCMFIPCLAACELVTTNQGNQNNNGDNSNNNGDNSNNNGDNSNNNGDNSNNNGDNSNNNGDNSTNNGGNSTGDDRDGLPEKVDMEGYTYNAYVRGQASGNGSFYCEDFWVDPKTSGADALSYAVIQRNNEIEKDYNCTIKQTWSTQDNMYSEMRTFFEANQKYELAILLAADAATCAVSGLLSDLNASVNSEHLDLTNDAFDQNSIEHMTLGENLYFLSGDMNISTMDCTVATVFNMDYYKEVKKNLVDKLGDEMYGDLYEMVSAGTWTLDNMLKMADVVTDDADDSDGGLSYEKGDTIGYFQYYASPLYYYYAAGMRITSTSGGYPSFDIINDENAQEVYEYLFDKLNIKKNANLPQGYSQKRAQNFLSGQVLFTDYILWDIRTQLYPQASDLYYGILPNPNKDGGKDYYSCVFFEATVHLWAIPSLRENTEYAARMLEVMAAYSDADRDSTMDAYYVKTMYMKVARDDGSRASLDIIREGLVYDIALMYSSDRAGNKWGNFDNLLLSAADAANYEYDAYTTESRIATAESELQDTIDTFKNMSGK